MVKNPSASEGDIRDVGSIPGSGRSPGGPGSTPGLGRSPGEGNGNPLQYSCLENLWIEKPDRLQSTGSQTVGHD